MHNDLMYIYGGGGSFDISGPHTDWWIITTDSFILHLTHADNIKYIYPASGLCSPDLSHYTITSPPSPQERINRTGTHCPMDKTSKGRIVKRTYRPRAEWSKGRNVQETNRALSKEKTVLSGLIVMA